MGSLDDLLTVQEHDSAIDRLRARRERLPERQQLGEHQAAAGSLDSQLAVIQGQRDGVVREERQLDDNVSALATRIKEVEEELYSNRVMNPRELQALQADIEQLRRQRNSLEDQELDAMERREGLDGEVAQLEEKLSGVRTELDRLASTVTQQEHEIGAELDTERSSRDEAAARVPPELLETYEAIRARNDGVGAARLVGGTCQGCHLALPAVEVDRIKRLPADEVVRCDQCGAILVRS